MDLSIIKFTDTGKKRNKLDNVYDCRWVALSAFTACLFINGAANAFYSPITFIVKKVFIL